MAQQRLNALFSLVADGRETESTFVQRILKICDANWPVCFACPSGIDSALQWKSDSFRLDKDFLMADLLRRVPLLTRRFVTQSKLMGCAGWWKLKVFAGWWRVRADFLPMWWDGTL